MAPAPAFAPQPEVAESSLLSVRVLRAHGFPSRDLLSPSDCYVCLWLPTATSQELRTRTVRNCSCPVWNQTFRFRIQGLLKNVLELKVFDRDQLSVDDLLFSVLFDVGTLRAGETRLESFTLNPQGPERLDVEFHLRRLPEPPEQLLTNGVLVARELCSLDVCMEKASAATLGSSNGEGVELSVVGSYEGNQKVSVHAGPVSFHCPSYWDPELTIHLQNAAQEPLRVPLRTLPPNQPVKVAFPSAQETPLELKLKAEEVPGELSMRLGFGPCAGEQAFLGQRKQVVAKALKRLLQLEEDLPEDQVPVVAVMANGGGIRAMTALLGQLSGLQQLGLLDCVTYITGASGSTWAMADLYEDPDWSRKDLAGPIAMARARVTRSKLGVLAPERLWQYQRELRERAEQGHPSCFTDLWCLLNEALLHDQPHHRTLSEQRKALSRGQNPLPIYCALNTKDRRLNTFEFGEWVEFTPYEVGFPKYGAFIPPELFGSEFFMGRLMKRLPESRICFLEGIWSNLFAANLEDSLYWTSDPAQFWDRWAQARASLDKEVIPYSRLEEPPTATVAGRIAEVFKGLLTRRPLVGSTPNFLRGLEFHRNYFENPNFSAWKDTILDALPNQLTPSERYLCLLDVGYFVNTSCLPLLPPDRDVDLILSFDYSLDGAFQQLELVGRYCREQSIPFPAITPTPEELLRPQECHIFSDPARPDAPVVLHFPLVSDSFRHYSVPGVRRGPAEETGGELNLAAVGSPYHYTQLTYSEEDADKLLGLARYNICNNQEQILEGLREAVERRRRRRRPRPAPE
ncbi:cytosolic phospholipase A2 beta-like isoform X1 [Tachyglossus aculeatus]|uniref:cytosolic phospholipase A2 beta-like isoform X1 n=1 Tax=Tachyglossus aculeatus TaxID=9261 RepID=UPI0018F78485|nr:cytosolic phospholipase A2 beta-like isoform X1 [Tachyglossus aculeatus]